MACSWGINHEHLICLTINMLCSTYYCKIMFLCRNNPKGCWSGSNCRIWQILSWNNIFIRSKSDHYIALSVSQFQTEVWSGYQGWIFSSQPSMVHWLISSIFHFSVVVLLWWHTTKSPLYMYTGIKALYWVTRNILGLFVYNTLEIHN